MTSGYDTDRGATRVDVRTSELTSQRNAIALVRESRFSFFTSRIGVGIWVVQSPPNAEPARRTEYVKKNQSSITALRCCCTRCC
ncbi:MAG: hypothetical protein AB1861_28415 [Cyanobacteriota bacterium]